MSTALDIAFYTRLTGDAGTGGINHPVTGATGGFHNPVAPQIVGGQPVGFPRVHFSELVTTAMYAFANLSANHVYYQFTTFAVDGQSGGVTITKTLSERIRTLLTDPSMSVTGSTLLHCRFIRTNPLVAERDETKDRFIYSQGIIVEAYLT